MSEPLRVNHIATSSPQSRLCVPTLLLRSFAAGSAPSAFYQALIVFLTTSSNHAVPSRQHPACFLAH